MDAYEKNILEFGDQLSPKHVTARRLEKLRGRKPDGVIIVGMGGSGLAGEIIKASAKELRLSIPIILWKDYGLPTHSFKRPFYVFVSFSGNTEETLSGLTMLFKSRHKNPVSVVTTGGSLHAIADEKNLAIAAFRAGTLTPRQSVGIILYAITELLHAAGLMPRPKTFDRLDPRGYRNAGLGLAKKLRGRLITVYTDTEHRHLGYIWKIKFNETSKVPAFNNVLPEMDHNELTAFDVPPKALRFKNVSLFLTNKKLSGRLAKKFQITERLIKSRKNSVLRVSFEGDSELEKAWRTLILADWTSYFLGKLYGIPPAEFNIVNPRIVIDLKKLMG